MEFERAIFRIYERCIEGLDDNEDNVENEYEKSCRLFEVLCVFIGMFLLFALILLHASFVGSSGCLPDIIGQQYSNALNLPSNASLLNHDQMLVMSVTDREFIPTFLRVDDKYDYLRGGNESSSSGDNNSNNNNSTNTSSSSTHYPKYPDSYIFSFEIGILALPTKMARNHGFDMINVTVTTSESLCFGGMLTQSLIPMVGYDSIIMNMVIGTFKQTGYLLTPTRNYLTWKILDPVESNIVKDMVDWFSGKLSILLTSLCSFFILSTITALLVRVLISSGVVLLFPCFYLCQINLRIITLSYPWIGVPMEVLRSRNESVIPFLIAHTSRVIIYYVFYEAVQQAVSIWFYSDSSANREDLWLLVVVMLLEYYCMIYVRSAGSISLFPRASLALFVLFHIYYYSFPSGFHFLALSTMFAFILALMIHCVRTYEAKAFRRGLVNSDQTRSMVNSLALPIWRIDLPPDFSLFQPLSHRANNQGIYQSEVPPLVRPQEPQGGSGIGVGAEEGETEEVELIERTDHED